MNLQVTWCLQISAGGLSFFTNFNHILNNPNTTFLTYARLF